MEGNPAACKEEAKNINRKYIEKKIKKKEK